jgi:hypothetical protein
LAARLAMTPATASLPSSLRARQMVTAPSLILAVR